MFLKHAIKEYEFDCKARKLGVNTIQGYMRMLRYLMDYLDKEYDIPAIFYKHYPSFASGQMNVSEMARICGLSRPTVYKYLKMVG